jgi:hypothetical protein
MGSPTFAAINPLANPYITNVLDKMTNGKEMRRLMVERQALLASLEATGLAQPATILNFNPVALSLDGGLGFKVPSILDDSVDDAARFRVKFEGHDYKASVITVRSPKTFTQIKDVREDDGVAQGVYEVKACKQIEIAHNFLVAYTSGTPSSSGMGGVVIFEGDLKQFGPEHKNLNVKIKVPEFIRLPNRTREYITKPKSFSECLESALKLQRVYCNGQTQQAQGFWDNEDERKNITPIHRIWHQYEVDMGWRQTPAPWVTLTNENAVTCEGCGEQKKRVTAYFCHKCARPYQPFEAYVAGELSIEHPSLNRCDAKQWTEIRAIEKKRKALREGV